MSTTIEMPEIVGLEEVLRSAHLPVGGKLVPVYSALEDAIKRAVTAAHNVKGQSVISLEIKIRGEGENTIPIEAKLKVKEPELKPMPAMFYADGQGRLYADDPSQSRLPLNINRKRG